MKIVAILDEILLTILLFSYNWLYCFYPNLQNRSDLCEKSRYQEWAHMMWFINLHVLILL